MLAFISITISSGLSARVLILSYINWLNSLQWSSLEIRSVSQGSKFPVRVRFWFCLKLDGCNGSCHIKNLDSWTWAVFTTENPVFQVCKFGSYSVFEFWLYRDMINMQIVQVYPLFHLPLPDLRLDQNSLTCNRTPTNIAHRMEFLHYDSVNIGLIANLNSWGGRAANTAQSTYWSCHNTIRTQMLNWSHSCRKSWMEPQSGFNPAITPWVYVQSR